jgi:hypothetical protein
LRFCIFLAPAEAWIAGSQVSGGIVERSFIAPWVGEAGGELKGETRAVRLTIDSRQLSLIDANGNRDVQPGEYELYVGGSQPSAKAGVFLPFHIEGRAALAP